MTCYCCSPFCSKCKPVKETIMCPTCGMYNLSKLRPDRTCKKCGSLLWPDPDKIKTPKTDITE